MDTYSAMITEWHKFCRDNNFTPVNADMLLYMNKELNFLTEDQIKYISKYLRRWRQLGF